MSFTTLGIGNVEVSHEVVIRDDCHNFALWVLNIIIIISSISVLSSRQYRVGLFFFSFPKNTRCVKVLCCRSEDHRNTKHPHQTAGSINARGHDHVILNCK